MGTTVRTYVCWRYWAWTVEPFSEVRSYNLFSVCGEGSRIFGIHLSDKYFLDLYLLPLLRMFSKSLYSVWQKNPCWRFMKFAVLLRNPPQQSCYPWGAALTNSVWSGTTQAVPRENTLNGWVNGEATPSRWLHEVVVLWAAAILREISQNGS